MGIVYLRNTPTPPDATYENRGAVLSHADLDNNLQLFLRNDVDDTMNGNLTVTGNITVNGTVDGRDLAADGTKLDGIAASVWTKTFAFMGA